MKIYILRYSLAIVAVAMVGCSNQSKTSNEIMNLLSNTCDCEKVVFSGTTNGLTFSKKNPSSTGEHYEFILENCNYTNMEDEADKLKNALLAKNNLCKDKFIGMTFRKDDDIKDELFLDDCLSLK